MSDQEMSDQEGDGPGQETATENEEDTAKEKKIKAEPTPKKSVEQAVSKDDENVDAAEAEEEVVDPVAGEETPAAKPAKKKRRRKPKPPPPNDDDAENSDNDKNRTGAKQLTWLEAAAEILRREGKGGSLHLKDIGRLIREQGLMDSSCKTSLEALMYRETSKSDARFIRIKDLKGHFMLASDAKGKGKARGKDDSEARKKDVMYQTLKRRIKQVLQENVSLRDEVLYMQDKVARLHAEKRYILKQLVMYESDMFDDIESVDSNELDYDQFMSEVEEDYSQYIVEAAVPAPAAEGDAADGPADGTPRNPSKPKRDTDSKRPQRKPAEAKEIKYDSAGKPVVPFTVGPITIHSLGTVVHDRPAYHNDRYIWPVGFKSSRMHASYKNPGTKCTYWCTIADGGDVPLFKLVAEDDMDNPMSGNSATACHGLLLKRIKAAQEGVGDEQDIKRIASSGPLFFGLRDPTVTAALSTLPGAQSVVGANIDAGEKSDADGVATPSEATPSASQRGSEEKRQARRERAREKARIRRQERREQGLASNDISRPSSRISVEDLEEAVLGTRLDAIPNPPPSAHIRRSSDDAGQYDQGYSGLGRSHHHREHSANVSEHAPVERSYSGDWRQPSASQQGDGQGNYYSGHGSGAHQGGDYDNDDTDSGPDNYYYHGQHQPAPAMPKRHPSYGRDGYDDHYHGYAEEHGYESKRQRRDS